MKFHVLKQNTDDEIEKFILEEMEERSMSIFPNFHTQSSPMRKVLKMFHKAKKPVLCVYVIRKTKYRIDSGYPSYCVVCENERFFIWDWQDSIEKGLEGAVYDERIKGYILG